MCIDIDQFTQCQILEEFNDYPGICFYGQSPDKRNEVISFKCFKRIGQIDVNIFESVRSVCVKHNLKCIFDFTTEGRYFIFSFTRKIKECDSLNS
jgi:hypothetical protein